MRRQLTRTLVFLLFLGTVTAASAARAAGTPPREEAVFAPSASSLREALSDFWTFLTALWSDEGASLDPDGKPRQVLPEPGHHSDEGASLDPDG